MKKRRYLKDIAYEKIKDMVIRGKLNGPMLSESELVRKLNISRTPIREALQVLHNEKFLEIVPKRGIYLKELTIKEAQDLMDMRLAIELFTMEKIPQFFSEGHLNHLDELIQLQKESVNEGDIYNFINYDLKYHEYFFKIIDNDFFVKTLNIIRDRLFRHGMMRFGKYPNQMNESIEDHIQINEFLRLGDFEEAKILMEKHIIKGKHNTLYS